MTTSHADHRRAGFTLLEVLIALAVMIAIVFATSRALRQTFEYRDRLQKQGEFFNGIRLAVGLVERDIALIYSPTLLIDRAVALNFDPSNPATNPGLSRDTGAPLITQQGVDLTRPSEFWGAALDPNGIRPSRFVGSAERMSFVSASNVRVYREQLASEFNKVRYELRPDTSENAPQGARALIRFSDSNAFETDDRQDSLRSRHQTTYAVLRGLRSFKLRYYRRDRDQWADRWDSTEIAEQRNQYPEVIELVIDVAGPLGLQFGGTYYLRRELPLLGIDVSH